MQLARDAPAFFLLGIDELARQVADFVGRLFPLERPAHVGSGLPPGGGGTEVNEDESHPEPKPPSLPIERQDSERERRARFVPHPVVVRRPYRNT